MVEQDEEDEAIRRSRDTANRVRTIAWAAFNLAFNTRQGGGRSGLASRGAVRRRRRGTQDLPDRRPSSRALSMPASRTARVAVRWRETGARPRELTEARGCATSTSTRPRSRSEQQDRGKIRAAISICPRQRLALMRRLASGKKPDEHLFTTAAGTPWTKSLHARRVAAASRRRASIRRRPSTACGTATSRGRSKPACRRKRLRFSAAHRSQMIEKHLRQVHHRPTLPSTHRRRRRSCAFRCRRESCRLRPGGSKMSFLLWDL